MRRARDEAVAAAETASARLKASRDKRLLLLKTLAAGGLDQDEVLEKLKQVAGLEEKLERLQEELAACNEKRDEAEERWKLAKVLRDRGKVDVAVETLAMLEGKLVVERMIQRMARRMAALKVDPTN